jgi:MOB kinase activator 1
MNRLLVGMIQVIQEVDINTGVAICNERECPTMSAGRYKHTADVHPQREVTNIPIQTHLHLA